MKKKSVLKLLIIAAVVLIVSVSFAGCNLVDSEVQFDDSGVSRGVSEDKKAPENKPTYFEATVLVFKANDLKPKEMGQSNHLRMTDELLSGTGILSDDVELGWNGKNILMTNITNYNLDLDMEAFLEDYTIDGSGSINGSNHSIIDIKDVDGNVLMTLEAHGTIVGNFFDSAFLDMNWTSVEGNARGKITGNFYWFYHSDGVPILDENENPIPIHPFGDFKLTGTYN